jgi:putative transposase
MFDCDDQAEAKVDINFNIVGFYNSERINSAQGNLSPAVFERDMAGKYPIGVSEIS